MGTLGALGHTGNGYRTRDLCPLRFFFQKFGSSELNDAIWVWAT